ncbi:tape measure protein [Bacillus ndiopicus]|uniref:tape measure protein n=1 Tax=Bacillus ndiopicus TaxID=1347368 RepID=UPI0005AA629C|nr:tape measure protein [Bacillus ndiopicus]
MATVQNAIQESMYLPQVINNLPQVSNNLPQVINNLPQVSNNLPQVINNLPQISNNLPKVSNNLPAELSNVTRLKPPSFDLSNLKLQMMEINVIFAQLNENASKTASIMDSIVNKVGSLAGKLLNLANVKIVIGLSDDMANIQGRLDVMNNAYKQQEQEIGVTNTALTTTSALQDMIFASAKRTFSSYQTTADMVTRLGSAASGAFSSPTEVVAFTEQLNKTFGIAGTSADGASTAMAELTQAMASGKLEGLGLNNILKSSPAIVENIQKYLQEGMKIDASDIKQLAADGVITADVIKNAMFYAAEDTNAAFASMPTTWGGIWQNIQTGALQAFSPVLLKINEIANSERMQQMIVGIGGAFQLVAGWAMMLMDLLIAGGSFIYDNWSLIAPVIMGLGTILLGFVAYLRMVQIWTTLAKNATDLWNAVLSLSPIGRVIVILIALIAVFYIVIAAINRFSGTTLSATEMIVGALAVVGAFIANLLFAILELAFAVVESLYNYWMAFANFFGNVFNDPVAAVIHLFGDLADNVLGVIEKIASALDFVFGTDLAGKVAGWRNELADLVNWAAEEYGNGEYEKLYNELDINQTLGKFGLSMERFDYGKSWNSGKNFGADLLKYNEKEEIPIELPQQPPIQPPMQAPIDQALSTGDKLDIGNKNSKQIADNTGAMANGVTLMNDDLKYMRDLAEREAINRYTTAEVIVDARSENHINSELDIDGVIDRFGEKVEEVAIGLAETGGVSFV